MPWTTVEDVLDIVEFVAEHDLVGNVDPVQFTIRLLIPPRSLMLDIPEIAPYLGDYDPESLSYSWRSADPRTEVLQQRLARLVVDESQANGNAGRRDLLRRARLPFARQQAWFPRTATMCSGRLALKPRLTEPWFCCAEPTDVQFSSLGR